MATAHPRAALESLLRSRKLDNTLTTALPAGPRHEDDVVSLGVEALDAQVLGGLSRGQLSEVVGPRSSGRTSLVQGIVAGVTRRGELAAVIDTLDRWDPAGLAGRGADLTRVLWVRGRDVPVTQLSLAPDWEPSRPAPGQRRRSHVAQALDRAVKALTLVLNAGGFGLAVLDLADVPTAVIRELPFTTWMRLQRMLEGSSTACVLLGAEPIARSAGGASIRLRGAAAREGPAGERSPAARGLDAPAMSFHAAIRASRRPYVGPSIGPRPQAMVAGRWKGSVPAARRFAGLSSDASVVRAHHAGQTAERVGLSFGT
jgi:recombination protein RecA